MVNKYLKLVLLFLGFSLSLQAVPTRDEILEEAAQYAGLSWYADTANTLAWDSLFSKYGCSEHKSSDWQAGKTYQGMAYSYGGNDDSAVYLDKLNRRLAAGNHMCHYLGYGKETGIYPPDWSTGIDCSAYVCKLWDIPRTNVSGIYSKWYHIDKKDVKPGDALAWLGHHIVLIADPGANPPYGSFALYEAAGGACRVWYNPAASWAAYAKYYAVSLYPPGGGKPDRDSIETGDTLRDDIEMASSIWHGSVTIKFPNTWDAPINYQIFSVTGECVFSGSITDRVFEVVWPGLDNSGRYLPTGVYTLRVTAPMLRSARFILLK